MSSLTFHLVIDERSTAGPWTAIIAHYLRKTADTVLAADGPIEMAADWPDLEAWQENQDGTTGKPVVVSANTAIALWSLLRTQTEPPPELVDRLEAAMRAAGWPPPQEPEVPF